MEEVSATDSMLLRAALDNDQAAWCRLVETYSAHVYCWARNDGLQDCDAAEIANQVFTSVARALPEFRHSGELDTFGGWLRQITRNAIADWKRSLLRLPFQAVGGTDNEEVLREHAILAARSSTRRTDASRRGPDASPEQVAVERVRTNTRPEVWRMFWLVTAEGMTPEEVAAECGVSLNVVYLTKHRIAKQIRREAGIVAESSNGGNDNHGTGEPLS